MRAPFGQWTSIIIGLCCAILAYYAMQELFGDFHGRHRIHWLGAALLALGGPKLLYAVMAIIAGGFAGLWYQVEVIDKMK